jgi:CO dehydrogenase/acetyl-CoA synthase delta subunit
MEAVGAVTYLMAGSDILIMRHPEAIRMAKAYIDVAMDGGSRRRGPHHQTADDVRIRRSGRPGT